jgi:hypothetical protein
MDNLAVDELEEDMDLLMAKIKMIDGLVIRRTGSKSTESYESYELDGLYQ